MLRYEKKKFETLFYLYDKNNLKNTTTIQKKKKKKKKKKSKGGEINTVRRP